MCGGGWGGGGADSDCHTCYKKTTDSLTKISMWYPNISMWYQENTQQSTPMQFAEGIKSNKKIEIKDESR